MKKENRDTIIAIVFSIGLVLAIFAIPPDFQVPDILFGLIFIMITISAYWIWKRFTKE